MFFILEARKIKFFGGSQKNIYYCVFHTHCFIGKLIYQNLMIAYVMQKTASIDCPAGNAAFFTAHLCARPRGNW